MGMVRAVATESEAPVAYFGDALLEAERQHLQSD